MRVKQLTELHSLAICIPTDDISRLNANTILYPAVTTTIMARICLLFLLIAAFASVLVSAGAPTFCKCTCFKNSTIIPLGPHHDAPAPPPDSAGFSNEKTLPSSSASSLPRRNEGPAFSDPAVAAESLQRRAASSSCAQCNRAFCLRYNLPICKGAEEKDVTTMCFQRDSRKDQIIVWAFILGTTGLLAWAAARRLLEMRDRGAGATGGSGARSLGSGTLLGGDGRATEPLVGSSGPGSRAPFLSSGWGWGRSLLQRRGSPLSGGLNPRDEIGRGAYSPISSLDEGSR
ncbi:hypothetical protein VTK73DRAFT_2144 [Phialemonium thermophilum]|uniref:Uncharacterized protein n=1 Tax=Phialemonium thermophilum TaxID=223376 RepID=A0ABR3VSH5_9PEZI